MNGFQSPYAAPSVSVCQTALAGALMVISVSIWRGTPRRLEDLKTHDLIGYVRETLLIDGARALGLSLEPSDFAVRTDSVLAQFAAIRAGCGIGVAHCGLAQTWPDVAPLMPGAAVPPLPLWLACHADVRTNPRIRRLMDFLGARLREPYVTQSPRK